jgi:hypothetical protein
MLMPKFASDLPSLTEHVKSYGLLDHDVRFNGNDFSKWLVSLLENTRKYSEHAPPEYVIWAAIASLLAIILTPKVIRFLRKSWGKLGNIMGYFSIPRFA